MTAPRQRLALALEYPLALRGGVSVLVETLLPALAEHFDLVLVSGENDNELREHSAASHAKHRISTRQPGWPRQLTASNVVLAHFHFGSHYGWGNHRPGRCPLPGLARQGIKILSTVHSAVPHGHCHPDRPGWFKTVSGLMARWSKETMLRSVEREIAVSEHDLSRLRAWHPGQAKKFQRIYHSRLIGKPLLPVAGERKRVILNAGHIAWRKGQPVLARAFAQIATRFPEWELWLAGDVVESDAARAVEQTSREHSLTDRIRLLGRRNDMESLMRQASLYVQPSLEEALGLALQEAMWHGLPCIGSNVGGIPELITHGQDGLLVPPGDDTALADALARPLADARQRQSLAGRAPESILAKGMTAERMIAEHIALYESILARR